jgi:hypothetical protein
MATDSNPTLGSIQIRRGFYDNAIDQGWAWIKPGTSTTSGAWKRCAA